MEKRSEIQQQNNGIHSEKIIGILTCFMEGMNFLLNNGMACCITELIFLVLIIFLGYKCSKELNEINRNIKRKREKIVDEEQRKENTLERKDLTAEEKKISIKKYDGYIDKQHKKISRYYEKKEIIKKQYVRLISACFGSILLIFILNVDTISAFASEIFHNDPIQTESEIGEIVEGMTFYLDNEEEEFFISDDIKAVFYVHYEEDGMEGAVKSHMQELIDASSPDTFSNNLSIAEEVVVNQASKEEVLFDNACKEASKYALENNYMMWNKSLKHSSELDEIINLRLSVWNSGKCDEELASLIANDYQAYALEFQHQNKNGYAILYYYMQCIKWSQWAMSYEDADEKRQFDYIKIRYLDIASCELIPKEYRQCAIEIYNAMGEYSDYVKTLQH